MSLGFIAAGVNKGSALGATADISPHLLVPQVIVCTSCGVGLLSEDHKLLMEWIFVVPDMREHHLGLMETSKKYDVDHHSIARWERIFPEEGAEALMKERRGRTCAASGMKKGRTPKPNPKVEEGLIAETSVLSV